MMKRKPGPLHKTPSLEQVRRAFISENYLQATEAASSFCAALGYSLQGGLIAIEGVDVAQQELLPGMVLYGQALSVRGFNLKATRVLEHAIALSQKQRENYRFDRSVPDAKRFLAQLYFEVSRIDEAVDLASKAKNEYERLNCTLDVLHCDSDCIWRHLAVFDYQAAERVAQQCLLQYTTLNSHTDRSRMFNYLGQLSSVQGKEMQALEYFHSALASAERSKSIRHQINARKNIAVALTIDGQSSAAIDILVELLQVAKNHHCDVQAAHMCFQLGVNHVKNGEQNKAIEYYIAEQRIHQSLERTSDYARSAVKLAAVYMSTSDYHEALMLLHEALDACSIDSNAVILNHLHTELGSLYHFLGNVDLCLLHYSEALEQALSIGNVRTQAACEGNLGIAMMNTGQFSEALKYTNLALQKSQSIGLNTAIARHMMNAGIIHSRASNFEEAHRLLSTAIPMLTKHAMPVESAHALIHLGNVFATPRFLGQDVQEGKRLLYEGLEAAIQLQIRHDVRDGNLFLAELFESQGDLEKFAEHYRTYHAIDRDIINERTLVESRRLESSLDRMHLRRELESEQRKIETLTAEIELSLKELARKNEFLNSVRRQLQSLSLFVRQDGIDILEQLEDRLSRNLASSDDLSALQTQWTSTHATFLKMLNNHCPTLTNTELKVAALIRANMASTVIASVLFVSKRTVDYHRANIRRKLQIDSSKDLAVFLRSLF